MDSTRIRSFLKAVPDNKLILLDYYCDHTEIWRNTEKYYGNPYIWCYLGNFGGNTMIAGNLNDIDFKIKRLFKEGGDNVYGLGATLEGFDVNPLMYEFVFDQAWDYPVTTDQWITNWSMCRGEIRMPISSKRGEPCIRKFIPNMPHAANRY